MKALKRVSEFGDASVMKLNGMYFYNLTAVFLDLLIGQMFPAWHKMAEFYAIVKNWFRYRNTKSSILIKVRVAGINPVDTYIRAGQYIIYNIFHPVYQLYHTLPVVMSAVKLSKLVLMSVNFLLATKARFDP